MPNNPPAFLSRRMRYGKQQLSWANWFWGMVKLKNAQAMLTERARRGGDDA